MNLEEEYRLSEYQDLGTFNTKENIHLKRHKIYGTICVEKRISLSLKPIYDFLKNNPTPYIPKIYECIPNEEVLIIIEEYITGRNLEDIVCENKLDEIQTAKIALKLCEALKHLHNANPPIICRDLKAENVMVNEKNEIKIVDFNIARTFQDGKKRDTVLMGTLEYAAPEQFGYFQTDNRTDIYALGILINYMVTGTFPVEQMVTGRLLQIVRKSTFLDPKERYQTIEEMEQEIRKIYPECETTLYSHTKCSHQDKPNTEKNFTPPGFRSGVLWKKVVAIIGYVLIAYICFTMSMTKDGIPIPPILLRVEQTIICISQLILVGIICNYRGWRDKIPFLKSDKKPLRIIGYIIMEFILLFAAAFPCAILESFLI